ncbi:adenosylcobinamide-GDP ribazoletransferase [Endothiovibrio diazotrophicus]
MRPLWLAIQLLTVIPTPRVAGYDPRAFGLSVLCYPLVGAAIGALLGGAGWLLAGSDPLLAAALLLTLWTGISGGIHLDGLADTVDARVGSHGDGTRALEIMKDPRAGPMAVAALVVVLILKLAALAVLVRAQAWHALAAVPLAGRALPVALFLTTPYVRRDGLGAAAAACLPRGAGWLVLALVALLLIQLWGVPSFPLLIGLALLVALWRWWLIGWIGGTTGDTAGALLELAETALLVSLALVD